MSEQESPFSQIHPQYSLFDALDRVLLNLFGFRRARIEDLADSHALTLQVRTEGPYHCDEAETWGYTVEIWASNVFMIDTLTIDIGWSGRLEGYVVRRFIVNDHVLDSPNDVNPYDRLAAERIRKVMQCIEMIK